MTLHPHARAFLDIVKDAPPLDTQTVEQNRADLENAIPLTGEGAPVAVVEDRRIAGVGVRVYSPRPLEEALPVVVYFHGGGWVLGDLEIADTTARAIAIAAGATVVSVDYRKGPEDPFPAAVVDALAVTTAVLTGDAGFPADARRVAVAGDSAGGNLAAVTAQQLAGAHPGLVHQALIYPAVDARMPDDGSYRTYAEGHFLTARDMAYFFDTYAPGVDRSDVRLSPAAASPAALAGLPSATVITAECDPLHDEGVAYANALAAAGVPVVSVTFDGLVHPFVYLGGLIGPAHTARRLIGGEIRAAFDAVE
ncbi:alpha/beta hydrolase [Herbiconiux sp. CPCC 203407]|uniref:Alpha/beta hydrolase n=1 Tax=Herbiconiux oxytropis TaxID=2970915 RepID=A0AA41XIK9_9MICO|nr:alpha/beta hydrolase [Herbiconiux oxytropis]MCS5722924.1 alpha/beta hydrolase [Herbiconiux oxytropis]MCS5725816.1 alpha/beta hydrolase [Herbiconiux oxytropis]